MGMLLRRHNIPLGNIVERVSDVAPSPNIVEKVIVEKTTTNYTKTDIKRMPLDDLKALATNSGVVGADDMTGGELKKVLIDKFGL